MSLRRTDPLPRRGSKLATPWLRRRHMPLRDPQAHPFRVASLCNTAHVGPHTHCTLPPQGALARVRVAKFTDSHMTTMEAGWSMGVVALAGEGSLIRRPSRVEGQGLCEADAGPHRGAVPTTARGRSERAVALIPRVPTGSTAAPSTPECMVLHAAAALQRLGFAAVALFRRVPTCGTADSAGLESPSRCGHGAASESPAQVGVQQRHDHVVEAAAVRLRRPRHRRFHPRRPV
jgi:hypothetical protein